MQGAHANTAAASGETLVEWKQADREEIIVGSKSTREKAERDDITVGFRPSKETFVEWEQADREDITVGSRLSREVLVEWEQADRRNYGRIWILHLHTKNPVGGLKFLTTFSAAPYHHRRLHFRGGNEMHLIVSILEGRYIPCWAN
jgi:hypothetical protein